MICRFDPAVEREQNDAAYFYDRQRTGLGGQFLQEVQRIVGLLIENPELGKSLGENHRVVVLNRFPFHLVYALEDARIRIISVAHQKRRPGYWRQRVEEPRPTYTVLPIAA